MNVKLICAGSLVSLLVLCGSVIGGELFSQSYALGEWSSCGLHCRYIEVPVNLPQSLNRSVVDSVWVTVEGVSQQGSITFSQGGQSITYDCWDGLLVSFEASEEDYGCTVEGFGYDGISDYVAGVLIPSGDGVSFQETLIFGGIERTECCELGFETRDAHPDFGELLSNGSAVLRIQQVNGGRLGPGGGCVRCLSGLALLTGITVNVSHSGQVATEDTAWGELKAQYR